MSRTTTTTRRALRGLGALAALATLSSPALAGADAPSESPGFQELLDQGKARKAARIVRKAVRSADQDSGREVALQGYELSELVIPIEARGDAARWLTGISPVTEVEIEGTGLAGSFSLRSAAELQPSAISVACERPNGKLVPAAVSVTMEGLVRAADAPMELSIQGIEQCWRKGATGLVLHSPGQDLAELRQAGVPTLATVALSRLD